MIKINKITAIALVLCMGIATLTTGCQNQKNTSTNTTKSEEKESTTAELTTVEDTIQETTTQETTTAEETTTEEATSTTNTSNGMSVSAGDDDIDSICEDAKEATTFNSLYEFDAEDLMDYYGIDVSRCESYVFCVAEISPCADTIAMFQAKSQRDAQNIADALQVYIDSLATSTQDYAPEEYNKVCNTGVRINDSFVYLVIAADPEPAIEVIESHLK